MAVVAIVTVLVTPIHAQSTPVVVSINPSPLWPHVDP